MKTFNIKGKKIKAVMLLIAICLVSYFGATSYGGIDGFVSVVKSGVEPIYEASTNKNAVSITFDAIWTDYNLDNLLMVLDEYNIKATFFVTGKWIENYPESAKKIVNKGHELGNHSYNYPNMNQLSKIQIKSEIISCEDLINEINQNRSIFFRPPYGDYSADILSIADAMGYKTIMWNIDAKDWAEHDTGKIVENATKDLKKGSIILMHVDGPKTAEALPSIINEIKSKEFEIVTVSDLLGYSKITENK